MIVRVLHAKVRANKVSAFDALFLRQVSLLRAQPGLEYVKLARRIQPDGSEDVVLFEEWRDTASLYAWVGPNLRRPRLVPGARELMDELSVAHYEALDRGIDGEDPIELLGADGLLGDDGLLDEAVLAAPGDGGPQPARTEPERPQLSGAPRGRAGRLAPAEDPRQTAAARLLR